jgi:orotate phosphoribosyltransferase
VADSDSSARVQSFITLLTECRILKWGNFTLKSGRQSNYFIDFGSLEQGSSLLRLGACYADKIYHDIGVERFDVIFGPSYKGSPLALATTMALSERWGVDKQFSFNRKEAKDHGEGGIFIGRRPAQGDRVLIIDDVITDGATKFEMVNLLREATEAEIVGVLVGVDRSEPGVVETFEREAGMRLWSIADAGALQAAST